MDSLNVGGDETRAQEKEYIRMSIICSSNLPLVETLTFLGVSAIIKFSFKPFVFVVSSPFTRFGIPARDTSVNRVRIYFYSLVFTCNVCKVILVQVLVPAIP